MLDQPLAESFLFQKMLGQTPEVFRDGHNFFVEVHRNEGVWKLILYKSGIPFYEKVAFWIQAGEIGQTELDSIEIWLTKYKMRAVLGGVKKLLDPKK